MGYCAILSHLKQLHPKEPTGNPARLLQTLAALVSGIIRSKKCHPHAIANKVPDGFLPLTAFVATAGQPTEAELAAVKAAGYEAVINVLPVTSPNALPQEKEIVSGLGLEYIYIPVDWPSPEAADAERFFDVLDAHQGRRIFVHCAANMRVSAFMYLYRTLRQHVSPEEAARDLQRIWIPNETWQRLIDSFNPTTDKQNKP